MKYAVLGTGIVGQQIAGKIAALGHAVAIGTRDPETTLARDEPDFLGNPPFRAWYARQRGIALLPYAEAAAFAEIVVLAGQGKAAFDMLNHAGAHNLANKVLIDITNPLDFSAGFPPRLFVVDTDSLGEQIQKAFPEARVVKALNTLAAKLMVEPKLLGEASSAFVSGNDAAAKAIVIDLMTSFGHADVIDLGGIESCRGTEMIGPIWMRLFGALGTDMFNFKIIRK